MPNKSKKNENSSSSPEVGRSNLAWDVVFAPTPAIPNYMMASQDPNDRFMYASPYTNLNISPQAVSVMQGGTPGENIRSRLYGTAEEWDSMLNRLPSEIPRPRAVLDLPYSDVPPGRDVENMFLGRTMYEPRSYNTGTLRGTLNAEPWDFYQYLEDLYKNRNSGPPARFVARGE